MKVEVVTFGCRLNSYESSVIQKHAEAAGMRDAVIINSCAVTSEAERQVRQTIRKVHRQRPDAKILVTGCSAQIDPDKYISMPEVSKVIGNHDKMLRETYASLVTPNSRTSGAVPMASSDESKGIITDIFEKKKLAISDVKHSKTREFIQVQSGCDHRCTFCIIPYGRGNSRSVSASDVINKAAEYVANGTNELVITGVDITSYGTDLYGEGQLGLLLKRLLREVPQLPRLRLSSIDVAEIDKHMMDLILYEPRFMPHLHLSLQAGDNMILKRMKRRHNREMVIETINKIREDRKVVLGADIIAGFPTETDDMFQNTYNLIKELNIIHAHIFPYSERNGTPAARMPQVPKHIRKERAAKLRTLASQLLYRHYKAQVGSTHSVIIEKSGLARSEDFSLVKINSTPDNEPKIGSIQDILITDYTENHIKGKQKI